MSYEHSLKVYQEYYNVFNRFVQYLLVSIDKLITDRISLNTFITQICDKQTVTVTANKIIYLSPHHPEYRREERRSKYEESFIDCQGYTKFDYQTKYDNKNRLGLFSWEQKNQNAIAFSVLPAYRVPVDNTTIYTINRASSIVQNIAAYVRNLHKV